MCPSLAFGQTGELGLQFRGVYSGRLDLHWEPVLRRMADGSAGIAEVGFATSLVQEVGFWTIQSHVYLHHIPRLFCAFRITPG